MCIALFVKPGAEISDEVLKTCYINNDDGCGFAYVSRENKVVVNKTMNFDTFLADFREAQAESTHSPFLVHFRIATHGTVDEFNCHPFFVDEDTAFIHNGVIHGIPTDHLKSDTQMFNELILQGLPEGWEFNLSIKPLIEDFIGYSKLVVLKSDCTWNIFNEKKGEWNTEKDIWYSNTSYKPRVRYGTSKWNTTGNKWDKKKSNAVTTVTGRSPQPTVPATQPAITASNSAFNNLGDVEDALSAWLVDLNDKMECNNCCNYHTISEMSAYSGPIGNELYCNECEEAVLMTSFVDPKDEISIEEYIEEYNDLIRSNSTSMGCN